MAPTSSRAGPGHPPWGAIAGARPGPSNLVELDVVEVPRPDIVGLPGIDKPGAIPEDAPDLTEQPVDEGGGLDAVALAIPAVGPLGPERAVDRELRPAAAREPAMRE